MWGKIYLVLNYKCNHTMDLPNRETPHSAKTNNKRNILIKLFVLYPVKYQKRFVEVISVASCNNIKLPIYILFRTKPALQICVV